MTIYVIDTENKDDSFYQHLINLQVNIIPVNPINNIDSATSVDAAIYPSINSKEVEKYNIKVTTNIPSRYALDSFYKNLFYLYNKYIGNSKASQGV